MNYIILGCSDKATSAIDLFTCHACWLACLWSNDQVLDYSALLFDVCAQATNRFLAAGHMTSVGLSSVSAGCWSPHAGQMPALWMLTKKVLRLLADLLCMLS